VKAISIWIIPLERGRGWSCPMPNRIKRCLPSLSPSLELPIKYISKWVIYQMLSKRSLQTLKSVSLKCQSIAISTSWIILLDAFNDQQHCSTRCIKGKRMEETWIDSVLLHRKKTYGKNLNKSARNLAQRNTVSLLFSLVSGVLKGTKSVREGFCTEKQCGIS